MYKYFKLYKAFQYFVNIHKTSIWIVFCLLPDKILIPPYNCNIIPFNFSYSNQFLKWYIAIKETDRISILHLIFNNHHHNPLGWHFRRQTQQFFWNRSAFKNPTYCWSTSPFPRWTVIFAFSLSTFTFPRKIALRMTTRTWGRPNQRKTSDVLKLSSTRLKNTGIKKSPNLRVSEISYEAALVLTHPVNILSASVCIQL